jgi:hypothetical protein
MQVSLGAHFSIIPTISPCMQVILGANFSIIPTISQVLRSNYNGSSSKE